MKTIVFAIALLSACTHHMGHVDYSAHGIYASAVVGNKEFQDVGEVGGSSYSWLWTDCDTVVAAAVEDMMSKARAMGADTVYDVKFNRDGIAVKTPSCTRQWGWVTFFLIPAPVYAQVTGVAAKTSHGVREASQ